VGIRGGGFLVDIRGAAKGLNAFSFAYVGLLCVVRGRAWTEMKNTRWVELQRVENYDLDPISVLSRFTRSCFNARQRAYFLVCAPWEKRWKRRKAGPPPRQASQLLRRPS
jgi:hypothetical protein